MEAKKIESIQDQIKWLEEFYEAWEANEQDAHGYGGRCTPNESGAQKRESELCDIYDDFTALNELPKMSCDELIEKLKSELVPEKLEKRTFTIDDQDYFEGYHYPSNRWNGWACPYFTKEEGMRIAEKTNNSVIYDAQKDCFRETFQSFEEEEPNEYGAVTIDGMKLYGIGFGVWVWDDIENDGIVGISTK